MMQLVFSSRDNAEGQTIPSPFTLTKTSNIYILNEDFGHMWMSVFSISIDRFHCAPLEPDPS